MGGVSIYVYTLYLGLCAWYNTSHVSLVTVGALGDIYIYILYIHTHTHELITFVRIILCLYNIGKYEWFIPSTYIYIYRFNGG